MPGRPGLDSGLAANLGLEIFQHPVQMSNRLVASLRTAGIRERVGGQASQSSLIDDDVDVFDEIRRRCAAVAPDPVEVAGLNRVDDRPEIGRPYVVNAFRVDDGSIREDLKEHSKLATVVGTPQRKPGQTADPPS